MMCRFLQTTTLAVACFMLPGCALLQQGMTGNDQPDPAMRLIFFSQALEKASPSGRMAILDSARENHDEQPTAADTARLALAYGQPGYKGYSPKNCASHAREALSQDTADWAQAARAYMMQVANLCAAHAKTISQNRKTKRQLIEKRKKLQQAQHKLQALTRIENRLSP